MLPTSFLSSTTAMLGTSSGGTLAFAICFCATASTVTSGVSGVTESSASTGVVIERTGVVGQLPCKSVSVAASVVMPLRVLGCQPQREECWVGSAGAPSPSQQ